MNLFQEALVKAFKHKADIFWEHNEQEYLQLIEHSSEEYYLMSPGACWTQCYILLRYHTLNSFFSYLRHLHALEHDILLEILHVVDTVNQLYKLLSLLARDQQVN